MASTVMNRRHNTPDRPALILLFAKKFFRARLL
jgi:hypothetical protein